jgi:hypothetical protein
MRPAFKDPSANQVVTELERLALRAAVIGFSVSLSIVILYAAISRLGASTTGMRSAIEAICVLLWPSAAFMLGAHTYHGARVLFLLSACLNAGYFVVATMVFVSVKQRFGFGAVTSTASAVITEFSEGSVSESLRRAGPIA